MPHAIMFLPTESLYAEVVRRPALQSEIQSKCRVTIAGPSPFMAILTSFQMGFHTLAIQKKGDEVWRVLCRRQERVRQLRRPDGQGGDAGRHGAEHHSESSAAAPAPSTGRSRTSPASRPARPTSNLHRLRRDRRRRARCWRPRARTIDKSRSRHRLTRGRRFALHSARRSVCLRLAVSALCAHRTHPRF